MPTFHYSPSLLHCSHDFQQPVDPVFAQVDRYALRYDDPNFLESFVILARAFVILANVNWVERGGKGGQQGNFDETGVIGDSFGRIGEGRRVGRRGWVDKVDQGTENASGEGTLRGGLGDIWNVWV